MQRCDSFAEFMAGGIAVVCGIGSNYRKNHILGHRPCVGMVGGRIYFHGVQKSYSEADAKLVRITDDEWEWLRAGLKDFLETIGRGYLYEELIIDRSAWQLITARHPSEKVRTRRFTMSQFRSDVWEKEIGRGGLIGDLVDGDRGVLPVIASGEMRRFVPVWENCKYMPPCQAACPTGIPVQKGPDAVLDGRLGQGAEIEETLLHLLELRFILIAGVPFGVHCFSF